MALRGRAGNDLAHALGQCGRGAEQGDHEQESGSLRHRGHLPVPAAAAGISGGPPRRQNTWRSIVSS
jgi:hypothetical protein